jgi:hypothetical protein
VNSTCLLPILGAMSVTSRMLCPGRKPPFLYVKRPARPYKTAIQKRFPMENANGAYTPLGGPDRAVHLPAAPAQRPLVRSRSSAPRRAPHPPLLLRRLREHGGLRRTQLMAEARTVSGWPKRSRLAHAFLWEYSYRRLKLAQFLGQLGVFLTRL